MIRVDIDRGWTLTLVGGPRDQSFDSPVPARVPGCVHLDLLRAGAISDPFLHDNERAVGWIDELDVNYRVPFEVGEEVLGRSRIELALDRVDTFGVVVLNGETLGRTANMHHPHRFDVRPVLARENVLEVRIVAAKRVAMEEEARLGPLPFLNTQAPFSFVRKCAYHFGWDWAPCLIGAGLGPVRIEAYDGGRIVAIRPRVLELSERAAALRVAVDIDGDPRCSDRRTWRGRHRGDGRAGGRPRRRTATPLVAPRAWCPADVRRDRARARRTMAARDEDGPTHRGPRHGERRVHAARQFEANLLQGRELHSSGHVLTARR